LWQGGANHSIEPPGPLGDLVWALTNVEQAWRLSRNRSIAAALYPLLAGAVNHYVHWLTNTSSSTTARVMNDTKFTTLLRRRASKWRARRIIKASYRNFPGDNLPISLHPGVNYSTYEPCQAACDADPDCTHWHFFAPGTRGKGAMCGLKSCKLDSHPATCPKPVPSAGCIAGVKKPRRAATDGLYHLPPTYSREPSASPSPSALLCGRCDWDLPTYIHMIHVSSRNAAVGLSVLTHARL
jgi:hypothetical protein